MSKCLIHQCVLAVQVVVDTESLYVYFLVFPRDTTMVAVFSLYVLLVEEGTCETKLVISVLWKL